MAKSDGTEDRVFDVAKPGKTAPDSSSRPVIVGHRTILKDPTITPAEDPEFPAEEKTSDVPRTAPEVKTPSEAKTIIPIEEKPAKDKNNTLEKKPEASTDETDAKPVKTPEEAKESVADEGKESKPEQEPEPESTESKENDDDGETSIASAQTQKEADKKEQEEQAKQLALEKTIEDKTYFVPIGEVKRKRSTRRALILILLVLLIGIMLADLLVDSGMIKTSVKAPIHIFKTTTN